MKKIFAIVLALCLMLALFAGCGSKTGGNDSSANPSSGDSAPSDELFEVTWVSPAALASLDFCWMHVANALGYFEDEGIKVNIVEDVSGGDAKYLAAGSADFSGTSPAVALSTADVGADNITAVCNVVVNNIFGFAYNSDSGISTWADLEGKTIATLAESFPALFDPILMAAGVDPATVNYVVYGAAEYEALNSGEADAMGTWISEYYMCQGMGYDTWDYLNGNEVLPQIANSVWVNNDFAAEHPDIVKNFVTAITKACYFCYLNPEAAADITLQKYPEIDISWDGAVGAVVGNVYGMIGATEADQKARIDAHEIGVYDMDTVQQTIDNLFNGGIVSKEMAAADFYTNDYVDTTWDYATVQADSDGYTFGSAVYNEANG